jgi:hypothetical protein
MPFASELEFQNLLADNPELLSGELVNPNYPRKWLLLKKEQAVPDGAEPSKWFSLDHLFIDQDAIPTLVEVKRSSDTRIRREVVGQMMDYAANGVEYWPVDQIRTQFENDHPEDPKGFLAKELELEESEDFYEEFWSLATENLAEKRIRLLFVADRITKELRRIVEFLNETMRPTEVLAVELKRFVAGVQATIVPMIFGQTTVAERVKASRSASGKSWPIQRISEWLAKNAISGNSEHEGLQQLFELSVRLKVFHPSGGGRQPGFACRFNSEAGPYIGWKVRSNNNGPQYWVAELVKIPDLPAYAELKGRLAKIGGSLDIELNDKYELKIDLEEMSRDLIEEIGAISTQLVEFGDARS